MLNETFSVIFKHYAFATKYPAHYSQLTFFAKYSHVLCFPHLFASFFRMKKQRCHPCFPHISIFVFLWCFDEDMCVAYTHSVWKLQKMSHSKLRAKRAMFTFSVDKSLSKMPKMVNLASFWKLKLAVKQCYQTGKF